MSRVVLPLAALLLMPLIHMTAAGAASKPQTKPNIVFILVDDARIGDFSAYGCNYGITPNIDGLAAANIPDPLLFNPATDPNETTNVVARHPQKDEGVGQ